MGTGELIVIVAVVVLLVAAVLAGLLLRGRGTSQPRGGGPAGHAGHAGTVAAPPPSATDVAPADQIPPSDLEVDEPEVDEPEAPVLERPAPAAGRLVRLRARLARSNSTLGRGLLTLLSGDKLTADVWDEVEETLLLADLGVDPTTELVDRLRERVSVEGVAGEDGVRALLREELLALVDPGLDRSLAVEQVGRPAVVLVVGVNGTGKTTTCGKLARVLVAEDRDVVLGAADTFRAAAADQLETWGARVGVPTVRSDRDGADPAAVAFDAVKAATEVEADVVLIDTAGRLQNKAGLMDELGKVKRVVEKQSPVDEVLLVLDATTGQNGMQQAKVFGEVVAVTGIVLTKLDGTAKGGIVVAVQRALGVPVKLVGLGEGPDDLAPFDPEAFVDALLQ
ncbi:signal recognition particle-docking protein FtsY [Spongisporangium articulatum]|uniref:Signal recognition particle receptor FtsY n=1 Tax=Spongisporangium articulatum TaxID=3362603 RepID=A0ABW8AN27_9ACTN